MSDQLERIKEIHNKANELFSEDEFDKKVKGLLMELFGNCYTDWLIEQTEKFERLEKAYFDDNFNHSGFMRICTRVFEGK